MTRTIIALIVYAALIAQSFVWAIFDAKQCYKENRPLSFASLFAISFFELSLVMTLFLSNIWYPKEPDDIIYTIFIGLNILVLTPFLQFWLAKRHLSKLKNRNKTELDKSSNPPIV